MLLDAALLLSVRFVIDRDGIAVIVAKRQFPAARNAVVEQHEKRAGALITAARAVVK